MDKVNFVLTRFSNNQNGNLKYKEYGNISLSLELAARTSEFFNDVKDVKITDSKILWNKDWVANESIKNILEMLKEKASNISTININNNLDKNYLESISEKDFDALSKPEQFNYVAQAFAFFKSNQNFDMQNASKEELNILKNISKLDAVSFFALCKMHAPLEFIVRTGMDESKLFNQLFEKVSDIEDQFE